MTRARRSRTALICYQRAMPPSLLLHPWRWPSALKAAIFGTAIAALLWASLAPGEDVPGLARFWDKAEHAIAYLTITALGLALYPTRCRRLVGAMLVLGAGIEVLQATMGFGRDGDWRDMLANIIGVAVAAALAVILRRRP
ncbi:hypothetical protein [Phenylobacterium sp.]|uniref:hypothetical protein n=1 Tax=Phenylobacterium sp. TaxID=1871053 RepID=UPI0027356C15|nr:hypothetical protein [Phenylobacterium sp.]MDP3659245.1 hypothetical protein [Phenylobacterium sp.]